jgi:hypothetical protein
MWQYWVFSCGVHVAVLAIVLLWCACGSCGVHVAVLAIVLLWCACGCGSVGYSSPVVCMWPVLAIVLWCVCGCNTAGKGPGKGHMSQVPESLTVGAASTLPLSVSMISHTSM